MAKGIKTGGKDWQPGESGNPKGRATSDRIKQVQKITNLELIQLLNDLHGLSVRELEEMCKDKETPAELITAARMILRAVSTGNTDALYDRLVGKVKQVVENLNPPSYVEQRLREAESLLMSIFLEDKKRAIELEVKPGLIGENGNNQTTSEVPANGEDSSSGESSSTELKEGSVLPSEVHHRV